MRDIELIIRSIGEKYPAVEVRQLKVLHPGADDDGLWFFSKRESRFEVQIESASGMCPFLIETDEPLDRRTTNSVAETVHALGLLLHLSPITSPDD
jgi:hypothetical protein